MKHIRILKNFFSNFVNFTLFYSQLFLITYEQSYLYANIRKQY